MINQKINVRVRLIIIKKDKIFLHFTENGNFYFYPGGHLEFGETILECCQREMLEEVGAKFEFKKILYIRDFIHPEENEHSLELFILGDINKFGEIEGLVDPQSAEKGWKSYFNWINLSELKSKGVKPKNLTERILQDYKGDFPEGAVYLNTIE